MLRTKDAWRTVCELTAKEADPVTTFTDPPVTAAEGRHTVEIIQAAYQSSETGEAVALPL